MLNINLFCRKQWIQLLSFHFLDKFIRVMSTLEYQVLFIKFLLFKGLDNFESIECCVLKENSL